MKLSFLFSYALLTISMGLPTYSYSMLAKGGMRTANALRALSMSQKRTFLDAFKLFLINPQKSCAIIERLGKYNRTVGSGFHFKWPLIENARDVGWGSNSRRIDLREHAHDLPKQPVITQDNVEMSIGGIIYYKIEENNPQRAVYEIKNLPYAIERLAQTTLRNIIGSMHFDTTLTSRDQINKTLCSTLDGATDKWGVIVSRVELQEITPPREILHAMEKQMTAERERRSLVIQAEGQREAMIKKADGDREATIKRAEASKIAAILEAEGDAEARIKRAQAEADGIGLIQKVSGDNAVEFIKAIEYIRTLPKITEGHDNKLVIIPHDMSSFATMLGVVREIIKK